MFTGILSRIALLTALSWLLSQKGKYLFTKNNKGFDLAAIVMLTGELFLIYKSVREIHAKLEGEDHTGESPEKSKHTFHKVYLKYY